MATEFLKSNPSEESSTEISTPWDKLTKNPAEDPVNNLTENHPTGNQLPENLPTKSPNPTCNFYLREIDRQGNMAAVKSFLETAISSEYRDFPTEKSLDDFCTDYAEQLSQTLSPEEQDSLKNYSGFSYKLINQVARGQWSYDLLGQKTPEKVAAAQESITAISDVITKAPSPEDNLVAYRGTNLSSFLGYQVDSIGDLTKLKNHFFLETGFTSTSLDPSRSFADRKDFDDPLRQDCNVTIEYLIPAGNKETVGLLSHDTSYNPEQREFLINKDSLSYISDVKINEAGSSAKLQMILIPRQIYDPATR